MMDWTIIPRQTANNDGSRAANARLPTLSAFANDPVTITLADIEAARRTIAGQVLRTPILAAPPLSALTGASVYVKYENLKAIISFKERAACVKLAAFGASGHRGGVIAIWAGNHAQAVAYH